MSGSNVHFSSGPSSDPFSMYSTSNSTNFPKSTSPQRVLTPRKASGYYNHPSFRQTAGESDAYVTTASASYSLPSSRDDSSTSTQPTRREYYKSGFGINSAAFVSREVPSDHYATTSGSTYVDPSTEVASPEQVRQLAEYARSGKRKGIVCGFVHNTPGVERMSSKTTEPTDSSHFTTTYAQTLGESQAMKSRAQSSEDMGTLAQTRRFFDENPARMKPYSTAFASADVPAHVISRQRTEDLSKYDQERKNKISERVLREMAAKDPILHDDIIRERDPFETSYSCAFEEAEVADDHVRRVVAAVADKEARARNFKRGDDPRTGFSKVSGVHVGDDPLEGTMGSAYRTDFEEPSMEAAHCSPFDSLGRRRKEAAGNSLSGVVFGTKQEGLSETLQADHRFLETLHPTVAAMVKRRNPATYGDAVPTYAHKKRTAAGGGM